MKESIFEPVLKEKFPFWCELPEQDREYLSANTRALTYPKGMMIHNGADCSGFTLQVFANYGISLPHSSRAQAGCGTQVAVSDAQPGDLIFYADNGSIYHVVIYIGDGQAVHASSVKTGIKISDVQYEKASCAVSLL